MDFDELVAVAGGKPAPIRIQKPTIPSARPNLKSTFSKASTPASKESPRDSVSLKRKIEDTSSHIEKKGQEPKRKLNDSNLSANTKPTDTKFPVKKSSVSRSKENDKRAAAPKIVQSDSYAEIMLKAKAVQEKEMARPNLADHYRNVMCPKPKYTREELNKDRRERQAKRKRSPRGERQVTKTDSTPWYKKGNALTPKSPKPVTPVSTYKGTAGLPSKRSSVAAARKSQTDKKRRTNQYLMTDEEDVDMTSSGGAASTPGSSASSDMEAGVHDVEMEEGAALRKAKAEDARELAAETEQRRAKAERKRRLEAQSAKYRR